MFLHDLTDNGYNRTLFLECAYILLVARSSNDFFEIGEDLWSDNKYKIKFLKDDNLLPILNKYASVFDQNINEKNYYYLKNEKNYSKFLENGIMRDFDGVYKIDEKYTHIDNFGGSSSNIFEYSHITFEESIRGSAKESCFPYLFSIFGYFMQKKLNEITKGDIENYPTTFGQLLENTYDPSYEAIYKEKLSTLEIKAEVFDNVLDLIFIMKSDHLKNISNSEKKIIIFQLIKCCFDYGKFGDIEKTIISKICKYLKVDAEYIEEFEDVIVKILALNKEAKELINE